MCSRGREHSSTALWVTLPHFFFFFLINLFNLFIFGCVGSSLLHAGFL